MYPKNIIGQQKTNIKKHFDYINVIKKIGDIYGYYKTQNNVLKYLYYVMLDGFKVNEIVC